VKQCGVVTADSLDETVDVVKALLYTKPCSGRRLGLIALTGGQSVVITDAFVRAGLEVPLLSERSYERLGAFFNIIGGSYRNPLDVGGTLGYGAAPENLERMLNILDEDENVDAIVLEIATQYLVRMALGAAGPSTDWLPQMLAAHKERSPKAFITILNASHLEARAAEERVKLAELGIPTFAGFDQGARALRKVIDYHRFRAGID
jgi:acyl-CoA synthetase (NDP forming)